MRPPVRRTGSLFSPNYLQLSILFGFAVHRIPASLSLPPSSLSLATHLIRLSTTRRSASAVGGDGFFRWTRGSSGPMREERVPRDVDEEENSP